MNSYDRQEDPKQIIESEEREARADRTPERAAPTSRAGILSPLVRTIKNSRALKGATAAVALTGTLAACSREPEVRDYTSCMEQSGNNQDLCMGELTVARKIHEETAPEYATREQCVNAHAQAGDDNRDETCERKTASHGGNAVVVYRPYPHYYYTGGGNLGPQPVYPTRSFTGSATDDEPRFKPSVRNTMAQGIKPQAMSKYTIPGKGSVPAVGRPTGAKGFGAGRGGGFGG